MPLTTIDKVAALVVIDLQKGIVAVPTAHPAGEIVSRSAKLTKAFRQRGLPVVLVNVSGIAPGRTDTARPNLSSFPADWSELVEELEKQPVDKLVTKQRWGAFSGTDLDQFLRQKEVTQVFITGISTSAGVESTARSAYELGYNVVIVSDAMTDRSLEAHKHSVETVFPKLAEVETTENVLNKLKTA